MRKVLTAMAMVVFAVCLAASVSWGATWESATWESATWETLDSGGVWE